MLHDRSFLILLNVVSFMDLILDQKNWNKESTYTTNNMVASHQKEKNLYNGMEFANKPTICSKIFDNDPARKLQCHLKLQPQALPHNIPKHLKQNFKVDSYTPKKLLDIISQVHQNDQKKPKHSYIHQLSTIFSNVHENRFMKIADLVISLICLVLTRKLC